MPEEIDRVNKFTLTRVSKQLQEPEIKRFLRFIYSIYLRRRYAISELGVGFRWGKDWEIRRGVLRVGDYCYIGPRVQIIYPTVIGDLVMIAADVQIISSNAHIDNQPGLPMRIANLSINPENLNTVVESDVWLGQRSTVMHGIRIGRGSIVAAGSIVTRDIPRYSMVAGVPARIKRMRFSISEIEEYEKAIYR